MEYVLWSGSGQRNVSDSKEIGKFTDLNEAQELGLTIPASRTAVIFENDLTTFSRAPRRIWSRIDGKSEYLQIS